MAFPNNLRWCWSPSLCIAQGIWYASSYRNLTQHFTYCHVPINHVGILVKYRFWLRLEWVWDAAFMAKCQGYWCCSVRVWLICVCWSWLPNYAFNGPELWKPGPVLPVEHVDEQVRRGHVLLHGGDRREDSQVFGLEGTQTQELWIIWDFTLLAS